MCPPKTKAKISDSYQLSMRAVKVFNLFIILCISCTVGTVNADDVLTAKEQLGRKIYREGGDGSQTEITATLGFSGDSVSATAFVCANCHGLEGEGKQEGGLTIPAITSQHLFAGTSLNSGAKKNYDESTLIRAITKGINSQNKVLSPTMPRYNLTTNQAQALLAYLKRLGSIGDVETGITDTEIQLATVLPLTGILTATGNLLKATLEACIADVNKQGLIYGRQIALVTLDSGSTNAEILASTKRLLSETKPFALISGYFPELTKDIYQLLLNEKIPVIAPLSFVPNENPAPSFFYFLPSYADQSRALVDYWLAQLPKEKDKSSARPKLAIVYSDRATDMAIVKAIRAQARRNALTTPTEIVLSQPSSKHDTSQLTQLKTAKPDAIFFLGNAQELKAFNLLMPQSNHQPILLGLLAMLGENVIAIPNLAATKLMLATPFNLYDPEMREFANLLARHSLSLQSPGLQRIACSAVNLVAEGLKRTGKRLSRTRFIHALEEIKSFPVEIMPPPLFGPNNRQGAKGAYILTVDMKTNTFSPISAWVTPTEAQ